MSKPVTRAPLRQEMGRRAARAAAVVQHVPTGHVAQRVQVIGFGLGEHGGRIDADDQRVVVAGEVLGLVPLLFELQFSIWTYGHSLRIMCLAAEGERTDGVSATQTAPD